MSDNNDNSEMVTLTSSLIDFTKAERKLTVE